LIADAIIAMTNWNVNGSIGARLPVQACRSKLPIFANLCENSGDSFLDTLDVVRAGPATSSETRA
jgi:hypothetical protein